jgi:hypothetical protein
MAQTINYEANGAYVGSDVPSINIDFTTTKITDVPTEQDAIQEIQLAGLVRYKTVSRPYPTGGPTTNCLITTTTSGYGLFSTIYLPTLANGAGTININALRVVLTDIKANTLFIDYSLNDGLTWTTYIALTVTGATTPPLINLGIPGRVQLRIRYNNAGGYFMFKSVAVTAFTPTFNTQGTYIGTPVASFIKDFSQMSPQTLPASLNKITEILGVGVESMNIGLREYPKGGTAIGVLQNTAIGSTSFIYLPALTYGVGVFNIAAVMMDGIAVSKTLFVESTINNGLTWTQVANPEVAGSNPPAAVNVNISGAVQLRIRYLSEGPYFLLKSMSFTPTTTSVKEIEEYKGIYISNGVLIVPEANNYTVFSLQGVQIAKAISSADRIVLRPGIYLVMANGKTQKVVVR